MLWSKAENVWIETCLNIYDLKLKKASGNFIEIVSLLENFCWPHVSACTMLSHYQKSRNVKKKI